MNLEIGLLAVGVAIPTGLLVWHTLATRRTVVALESRLARQADALALLTETSESGFAAIAQEMARIGSASAKVQRAPSVRRMTTAAQRGRSLTEIAAAEQMSEGEVHLRLQLARQAAADRGVRKRQGA